jgi:hypothetical protein
MFAGPPLTASAGRITKLTPKQNLPRLAVNFVLALALGPETKGREMVPDLVIA